MEFDSGSAACRFDSIRNRYCGDDDVRLSAALLLLLGTGLLVVDMVWRDAHQTRLTAAIRDAGGKVRDDRSLWWRFEYWREHGGEFPTDLRTVNIIDSQIDNQWLREHDWLAGLDVQCLLLDDSVTGTDLARLIRANPLQELYFDAGDITGDAFTAVCNSSLLKQFGPALCRLSDEQICLLPLEQYEYLTLVGTGISPGGLQQLRRCEKLATLGLDGRQFTPETAQLLASLGTIRSLLLCGEDVTDEDLKELTQIGTLEHISFQNTNTTPEGMTALKTAMPQLEIAQ